ncbi:hypothetical protein EDB80DRAFT_683925 [Ilyonectria destructans]|nr:hypothetical protein EDB80DRAFT_683925 [Ilyonectria destructans]
MTVREASYSSKTRTVSYQSPETTAGKKIALIGYAKDALHAALSEGVQFTFTKGAHRERLLLPLTKNGGCGEIIGLDGETGFARRFSEVNGPLVSTLHGVQASVYSPLGSQESLWKELDLLACSGVGPTQVFIDDDLVFYEPGNYSDPMGTFSVLPTNEKSSSPLVNVGLEILEGQTGVRMGFSLELEHDADLVAEAAKAAAGADIAIVFTGHDPQWESEGQDQESFHLPQSQDAHVSAVAAVKLNTVVVTLLASRLQCPGWTRGRLPVSFPRYIEDAPAHGNIPGAYIDGQLEVDYAEDVFVGYRHYDRIGEDKVNFPFSHGFSYTRFAYEILEMSQQMDDSFTFSAHISNIGPVEGTTSAQIYVGKRNSNAKDHPVKALVAFQKARLNPLKMDNYSAASTGAPVYAHIPPLSGSND